jgi:hypothetical protein
MKIQLISAYFVVFLSLSLHAMEERENGSITLVWTNQQKSAAGIGREENLEPNAELLSSHKEMTSVYAQQLAEELEDYLDQFKEDDTYNDIPASERAAFMRDEIKWAKNPTCYYNRCQIHKIQSAKIRYDLMKEHYRHKRNGRIGLAVLGGTTIAALFGVGLVGKAYLDSQDELHEATNLLRHTVGLMEKTLDLTNEAINEIAKASYKFSTEELVHQVKVLSN